MKYWVVEAYVEGEDEASSFGMLAPEIYKAKDLRKMIMSVHPEYVKIKFRKSRRPANCRIFMEEKKIKRRATVEEPQTTSGIGFSR